MDTIENALQCAMRWAGVFEEIPTLHTIGDVDRWATEHNLKTCYYSKGFVTSSPAVVALEKKGTERVSWVFVSNPLALDNEKIIGAIIGWEEYMMCNKRYE